MNFLSGYDLKNMQSDPSFFAYFENNIMVGVNSGHKCCDNSYRSRGLFVFPEYRNRGIGLTLLTQTIFQAHKESATYVWSYPKQSSWIVYEKAGFVIASSWEKSETSESNAFCKKELTISNSVTLI